MLRKLPIVGKNRPTEGGNRMKVERRLRFDDEGRPYLEEYAETDLNAYIQTHESSVNVNNIVARYAMGDETALERADAFYADISDMPVKLQDVLNINQKAQEVFAQMPQEIIDLYNGNYIEFVNDPERMKKLQVNNEEKPVEKPVETVEKVTADDKPQQ